MSTASTTSAANYSTATPATPKHRSMFRRFLAYYGPERGLFIADTVCALVIAGIDLAFPSILRSLTGGLFTEGRDAILGELRKYVRQVNAIHPAAEFNRHPVVRNKQVPYDLACFLLEMS